MAMMEIGALPSGGRSRKSINAVWSDGVAVAADFAGLSPEAPHPGRLSIVLFRDWGQLVPESEIPCGAIVKEFG